jgi:hypothetical protein
MEQQAELDSALAKRRGVDKFRMDGSVAQLVERGIHKPKVPGSNPGAAIF